MENIVSRAGARMGIVWVTVLGLLAVMLVAPAPAGAEGSVFADDYDGGDLWLHYAPLTDAQQLATYRQAFTAIVVPGADASPTHRHTADLAMEPGATESLATSTLGAARDELVRGLGGLLDAQVPVADEAAGVPAGAVVVGTPASSPLVADNASADALTEIGQEGYVLRTVPHDGGTVTMIAANTDIGVLYGTFAFLRRLQTGDDVTGLDVTDAPRVPNRMLNNWEEVRLYAGNNASGTGGVNGEDGTIFNFHASGNSADRNLPVILDRYIVMARALASVGVNAFTINLVNANNAYLTDAYIAQEAALADALRPYGIRLALAIRYDAPTDGRFAPDTLSSGQLDPTSDAFRGWWRRRAAFIQASIPDFIGFTVKANSEGEPGPQSFGYDHGDGANGMAAAVAPLGMTIYWRTFVYNGDVDPDRLKRPYLEFEPIDEEVQPDGSIGRIADNVFLQTKNGPLDFQAREPFHPMFGAMNHTNQAIELQITQEYTGQSTMLTYLGTMWEEVFTSDTGAVDADGDLIEDRLVGHIVEGTTQGHSDAAIVGVANLGNADNLTGHHFSQANLFAFGRQAWDWTQDAGDIAEDWTRMTWSQDDEVVDTIVAMMMGSWEAIVSYQTPLGLHHQFQLSDHYGPNPGERSGLDPTWNATYYNNADLQGLGYDRTPAGSGFTAQYFPAREAEYNDLATVPENLMLWFHHVAWDHEMASGRPFWDELVYRYQMGVQYVTWMRETWDSLADDLDARRFTEVQAKLRQHEIDAEDWRDTCVEYFRQFSLRLNPTDDGDASIQIEVDGRLVGGFDLSKDTHHIGVNPLGSPEITDVVPFNDDAVVEIVQQAESVPGTAIVKVTAPGFFGPLVQNYTFEMSTDVEGVGAAVRNRLP